jgi:hypothetical protein
VNIPYDSTLHSPAAAPTSTRREGFADVYVIPNMDTTNFLLEAALGFHGEVYCARFQYDLGFSADCVGTHIYGAIVNGLEYGDTSLIKAYMLPVEDLPDHEQTHWSVDVYPNPFATTTNIVIQSTRFGGSVAIKVYNTLGQQVYDADEYLLSGEQRIHAWPGQDNHPPPGLYVIRLSDGRTVISKAVILIR